MPVAGADEDIKIDVYRDGNEDMTGTNSSDRFPEWVYSGHDER